MISQGCITRLWVWGLGNLASRLLGTPSYGTDMNCHFESEPPQDQSAGLSSGFFWFFFWACTPSYGAVSILWFLLPLSIWLVLFMAAQKTARHDAVGKPTHYHATGNHWLGYNHSMSVYADEELYTFGPHTVYPGPGNKGPTSYRRYPQ